MKTVKKITFTFILMGKSFLYLFYQPKRKKLIFKNVPFFSQWESAKMVDQFLAGEKTATDDPNWKKSGAQTKREYLNWSWNACGMACFQMVLASLTGKKIPLITLCKQSLNYGCYTVNASAYKKGKYLESLPGLFYKPFTQFTAKEFNLRSKVASPFTIKEIIKELDNENFVIASVGGSIRYPNPTNFSKGGHLVLLLGFDLDQKKFILHNPSGLYNFSQKNFQVGFETFQKFFDHRGIIIYS